MTSTITTPRLLTRLWRRGRHEHQVGLDVEGGVVLPVGPAIAAALTLLDGRHTLAEAAALVEVDAAELTAAAAAIPERFWARAPATPHAVRLIGAGHLGRAVAELWAETHPAIPLVLVDAEPPPPGLYRHRRTTAADCLHAVLRAQGHRAVSVRHHWWDTPAEPTITVVAQDLPECDRALTGSLVRDMQPHLLVRPLSSGAVVGPLVEPGRTSCIRCADLYRHGDHLWPVVLAQASRETVVPSGHHLAWAAATAVTQLGHWFGDEPCGVLGATWERSDVVTHPDGQVDVAVRVWPRHPQCRCDAL